MTVGIKSCIINWYVQSSVNISNCHACLERQLIIESSMHPPNLTEWGKACTGITASGRKFYFLQPFPGTVRTRQNGLKASRSYIKKKFEKKKFHSEKSIYTSEGKCIRQPWWRAVEKVQSKQKKFKFSKIKSFQVECYNKL